MGQLRRRHIASCSRGTTWAAERKADERTRTRLKGAFRRVSSALFISRPALCAVWSCGGARRLCVRYGFHRDGGCGDLSIGGAELAGRVTELTRCWISLEVHVSVGTRGMETRRKKGECRWTPNAGDSVISPGGVGDVTLVRKAKPGSPILGTGLAVLYAHGRELVQYCF